MGERIGRRSGHGAKPPEADEIFGSGVYHTICWTISPFQKCLKTHRFKSDQDEICRNVLQLNAHRQTESDSHMTSHFQVAMTLFYFTQKSAAI